MNALWQAISGAALAGLGAVICSMGYRQIRFQAMTVGICVFAAAGAAAGALLGYPAFAAGLCAAGAVLGYTLHRMLFQVYVGLAAAMGGAAIGLLLALLCRYSSPVFLCGITAICAAVIALLETRLITMGWTAAAGAALVTHGVFRAIPTLETLPRTQLTWTLAAIFVLLAGGGFAFQARTASEEHAATVIAPAPAPTPSS